MGIFDYLKKTEAEEESKNNACVGVLDFLPMKETNQLLIVGSLEGSIKVGDQLQFCNPDQGMESLGTVEVKKLSSQNKDADSLTDEVFAHLVVDRIPSLDKLKKEVCSLVQVLRKSKNYLAIQMLFIVLL